MSSPNSPGSLGSDIDEAAGLDIEATPRSGPDTGAPSTSTGPSSQEQCKRRKVDRAKTACWPCRSRKIKCGGTPPDACPNCVEDSTSCLWPTEDRRSSQARKDKSRERRLQALAKRGLGRPLPRSGTQIDTPLQAPIPLLMANQGMSFDTNIFSPFLDGAQSGLSSFTFPELPSNFDPEQFILALSSQLPTVEDGSPGDELSPNLVPPAAPNAGSTALAEPRRRRNDHGRVVKITWWRPHGPTAIAPGLKRLSLKVRIEEPCELPKISPSPGSITALDDLYGADERMPNPSVMRHLIEIFDQRFGCQFPSLDKATLLGDLEAGSGSAFLLNCIASMAARFSTHPSLALPTLKPFEYGNVFARKAKSLLQHMLAVPSRETVMALVFLAHIGFANDSESEEWMFTGMAVRMAIDMALHLVNPCSHTVWACGPFSANKQDPGENSTISAEDRRLNRLTFWSVLLLDFALSFGVGRQTTFRVEEITQQLPTEEDVRPSASQDPITALPRSPFPFAARQMFSYGPLINLLNAPPRDDVDVDNETMAARGKAVAEYTKLPHDMQWNVTNLQLHRTTLQDSIFLHMHLWMHTVIASAYLTTHEYRRHQPQTADDSKASTGHATPTATANVWRNSARTIGDILVLSDVIDPFAYLALPFVNQAFYVAGCCYIKEIEQHQSSPESEGDPERARFSRDNKQIELFRSMLTSAATTSISTLQQGLARQTTYWSGVAWVAGTLEQRVSGIHADEIDITKVQEELQTYVSVPDAGLVERRGSDAGGTDDISAAVPAQAVSMPSGLDFGDLLSLPFDFEAPGTQLSI